MHYLSGIIGIVFVILALLSWRTPWIGAFYLACGVLAILAIRPSKVRWWLYTCCIASAVTAAIFFYRFFEQVETLSRSAETEISSFNYRLLAIFVGGFAMMYTVSEFCCWLKGRQDGEKLNIQLRRWRERLRIFVISRSQ